MKIVFFATPDIALNSFKYFINSPDFEVLALVTQKPKPSKRGKKISDTQLIKTAKENGIEIFEPDRISKDREVIEKLKSYEPDFFITFAFGQILSQEVIDIPKFATINLHASLLPCYRGANPICEAILNGEKKTGITTMKTALELDAGDICLQEEIELDDTITTPLLMEKISQLSPSLLEKTLKGLYDGSLKPFEQEHNKATFTKKIAKEDKNLDWNLPAKKVHDKIRAMNTINTVHVKFNDKFVSEFAALFSISSRSLICILFEEETLNLYKSFSMVVISETKSASLALLPEEQPPQEWQLGLPSFAFMQMFAGCLPFSPN